MINALVKICRFAVFLCNIFLTEFFDSSPFFKKKIKMLFEKETSNVKHLR